MSDYISKLRDLLLQQSKTGRLSSLLDSIYGAASTGAEAYGAANSPMAPQHAAGLLGTIADLTPVVGDVKSAYEGVQAAREGDWAGAGLGLLGALPFVPGITAWHGSPHKFDKFSLDKIGTGEGAQAYGHGLYLAEAQDVANQYATTLASQAQKALAGKSGIEKALLKYEDMLTWPDSKLPIKRETVQMQVNRYRKELDDFLAKAPEMAQPQLYRTDIPDEAVARFLDWDKPLSQQAEAMSVFRNAGVDVDKEMLSNLGEIIKKQKGIPYASSAPDVQGIMGRLVKKLGSKDAANDYLVQNGIPGIRYLDGGSRATGKGSSNFVVFDDQLPRILERNGVPTGNNPWGKGEWKPK